MKHVLFVIPLFFFFLILSINVHALDITTNSNFDTNIAGVITLNQFNHSETLDPNISSWSTNCNGYGAAGCLKIIGTNGFPYSFMYVIPLITNNGITYQSNNWTEFDDSLDNFTGTWFNIPANNSVNITAKFITEPDGYSLACVWNNTGVFGYDCEYGGIHLDCQDNTSFDISFLDAGMTNYGVWYTPSISINESINPRTCRAYIKFGMQAYPQSVYIDYFRVELSSSITPGPDITTNPAGYAAQMLGSLFGVSDIKLAENLAAIVFTVIISMVLSLVMAIWGKVKGKTISDIFIFSSLLFLVFFSLLGWFPAWLMVVLIIISAFTLSGVLGKMIGG